MQNDSKDKISRRDALKIIAAATGAAALSNIPSRWLSPKLAAGTLPAHAATSTLLELVCDADQDIDSNLSQDPITVTSGATTVPATAGITLRYAVSLLGQGGILLAPPPTGTVVTDGSGYASVDVTYQDMWSGESIHVVWSFENPSDGSGSCQQIFAVPNIN